MDIRGIEVRHSAYPIQAPAYQAVSEASQENKEILLPEDINDFISTDSNNATSISYIISFPDTGIAEAKQAVSDSGGTVRTELPIINGSVIDIPAANAKTFINSLPEGSVVKEDIDVKTCMKPFEGASNTVKYAPSNLKPQTWQEAQTFNIAGSNIPASANYVSTANSSGSKLVSKYLPDAPAVSFNAFLDSLGISELHSKGFTGKGVGVCVIDSGAYPHADIKDSITYWKDFTADSSNKPVDKVGHGTMVTGLIAGSGESSQGKIKGVAPDADIVSLRIQTVSEAITALQWVIENKDEYNIRVINISMGDFAVKGAAEDLWVKAAEKAIDAGVAVIVAAGNEGPGESTISTPGTSAKVLTVGSLDDKQTAPKKDDTIAESSSRGPSIDGFAKPDVLAPGVNIISALASNSIMDTKNTANEYIAQSGSSLATPIVSGLCALLLQANPNLTNEQLNDIIKNSADPLSGEDVLSQGKGVINPIKAFEIATA